jgi:anti-sigma B factor antagonist
MRASSNPAFGERASELPESPVSIKLRFVGARHDVDFLFRARAWALSSGRSVVVQISERRQTGVTILDVSGRIDLSSSPNVRKALLLELREKHTPRVIMNLTGVNYIDSSGVASLVEGLKLARELNSRFILFGLNPLVREVLQLTHLLTVFEVFDSEEQALA